ncbi:flagellar assembly protein FliW [Paenibacillus chibensis]|uniref:Flagellar assembly factor FliW n=1 Tax=Paenibacillus chibensis TaxID=59846 RepID=A0ABU6PU89_9BACL|nr:flagellar assembly protein FliW [Paenibacillus chibensis]
MNSKHKQQVIQSSVYGSLDIAEDQIYHFESDILGIPNIREYALLPIDDTLFFLLHAVEEDVSFVLLPAVQAVEGYGFQLQEETVSLLQLESPEDAGVMLIVNIHDQDIYVNLKAPIILSPHSHKGCQFIINDQDLPIRHRLERKEES